MSNMPDSVSKPELLNFEEGSDTWGALADDDARRKAVTDLLDAVENFGHHNAPEGRLDAYGDIIAPGETPARRAELLQPILANSSCALLVRTIWRMLGAKDQGKHLLDPPNIPGLVMTNVLEYAREAGARVEPKPDGFTPKPGDVLFINTPDGKHQHILTVYSVSDDGTQITSVDGGQAGLPETPPQVDDGGCNGIRRRTRTLDKDTLVFTDDPEKRKIVYWVDVSKLRFTEPMIKLTKGMSDDDIQ